MSPKPQSALVDYEALAEDDLVARGQRGDREAFRQIMQRCNQRLFRLARGVIGQDAEAEDVVHESYVRAFASFDGFRREAGVLTWLMRIVLNEARGRLRRRRHTVGLDELDRAQADDRVVPFATRSGEDPVAVVARAEARRLLERAIDDLPEPFRLVFVMRELEECSVDETAANLDLLPETVKTRLHRARRMLRTALTRGLSSSLDDTFLFLGLRCNRMTEAVLRRLSPGGQTAGDPKT